MPVEVFTPHNTNAHEYPEGKWISFSDGHLSVHKPSPNATERTLAIYAPGEWRHAQVVQS